MRSFLLLLLCVLVLPGCAKRLKIVTTVAGQYKCYVLTVPDLGPNKRLVTEYLERNGFHGNPGKIEPVYKKRYGSAYPNMMTIEFYMKDNALILTSEDFNYSDTMEAQMRSFITQFNGHFECRLQEGKYMLSRSRSAIRYGTF